MSSFPVGSERERLSFPNQLSITMSQLSPAEWAGTEHHHYRKMAFLTHPHCKAAARRTHVGVWALLSIFSSTTQVSHFRPLALQQQNLSSQSLS